MNYTPIIDEAGRGLGEALAPFWFIVIPFVWCAYVTTDAGINDDAFPLFLAFAMILFLSFCSLVIDFRKATRSPPNDPLLWFDRIPWATLRGLAVFIIFVYAIHDGIYDQASYPFLLKKFFVQFLAHPSQHSVGELQAFLIPVAFWVALAASSVYEGYAINKYAESPRTVGRIISSLLLMGAGYFIIGAYYPFILPNLLPFFGKSYATALELFVAWLGCGLIFGSIPRLITVLLGEYRGAGAQAAKYISNAGGVKTWAVHYTYLYLPAA